MRDGLFAAEWDLILWSAGLLSAILCEHARQLRRMAIDIGSLDNSPSTDSSVTVRRPTFPDGNLGRMDGH